MKRASHANTILLCPKRSSARWSDCPSVLVSACWQPLNLTRRCSNNCRCCWNCMNYCTLCFLKIRRNLTDCQASPAQRSQPRSRRRSSKNLRSIRPVSLPCASLSFVGAAISRPPVFLILPSSRDLHNPAFFTKPSRFVVQSDEAALLLPMTNRLQSACKRKFSEITKKYRLTS